MTHEVGRRDARECQALKPDPAEGMTEKQLEQEQSFHFLLDALLSRPD